MRLDMAALLMPRLGDALVVGTGFRRIAPFTYAAIAQCECGGAVYTAVSGSSEGCVRLLRRKHRKHLPACQRQTDLAALGLHGMTRVQTALALELGARVVTDPGWDAA